MHSGVAKSVTASLTALMSGGLYAKRRYSELRLEPGANRALREEQLYFPKKVHGRLTCMKVSSNHPDF